jgi:AAA+ superfamily predicted ATPase
MKMVRSYQARDLGRVLRLWEHEGLLAARSEGLTAEQAIDLINSDDAVALVAEDADGLVGVALGSVSGSVGWLQRITLRDDGDPSDVRDQLLDSLESDLRGRGARKLVTTVGEKDEIRARLEQRGYRVVPDLVWLEREVPSNLPLVSDLTDVGGRMIEEGLWENLKGMDDAKRIIEQRVILPLAEPDLAARHSVAPPKAIVLFGPPGTGKTTFAKGIASRLGWPFVEVQPSELSGEGTEREAALLAGMFERTLRLPAAVIFVDEVEDLASVRHDARKVSPRVTNEFLKQIPRMREAPHHLLVCATNAVGRLDPAFVRPGRFDYVLPVGPPDRAAREAIWQRYVTEITDEDVDVDRLVEASELFTPADIEFAARKAAQRAFEREHFEGIQHRAVTEEFLSAIGETRPTLTAEIVERFREDTDAFARD